MTRSIRPLLLAVMVVASVGFGLASGTVAAQDEGPSIDFSGCTEVSVTGEEYRITLYYEGGNIEDDNGPYNGTNTFDARDGQTIRKVSASGNGGMTTAENPNFESCTGSTETTTTETTTSEPTTTTTAEPTTTTTAEPTTTATPTTTEEGSETTTMTTTESEFDPDVEFEDCQTVTVNADEYDIVTLYFGEGDIADYVGPYTGENSFSAQSDAQDQPLREVSISSGDGMTSVENPDYESCLDEMGTTTTESGTTDTTTDESESETDARTDGGTDTETDARTGDETDAQTDGGVDSSLSSDADDASDQQAEPETTTQTAEPTNTDAESADDSTTDTTTGASTTDESTTEQAVGDDRSTASASTDGQETRNSWFADLLQLKFDSGQLAFSLTGMASLVAAGVLAIR